MVLFCYLFGEGAGLVSLYGLHPIGYGFFCGMFTSFINTFVMLAVVLWGIILTSGYMEGFKYGISMILFIVVYGLSVEGRKKSPTKNAVIAGSCLFVMNLTKYLLMESDRNKLVMGVLESILASAIALFSIYGRELLFRPPAKKEKSIKSCLWTNPRSNICRRIIAI